MLTRVKHTFMSIVQFLMSIGNWSVSQPMSGDPVLESMEPNIPKLHKDHILATLAESTGKMH